MNRIDFFAFRASPAAALCRQLGIDIGPCETWNDFTATLVSRNSTTDGGVVAASMGSPPPASVPCCMPSCMPAISTGWPTNSLQARPGTDCRVSPVPTHWPRPPASPGSADSPSRKPEQALLVSEPAHAMSQTAADRVPTPPPFPHLPPNTAAVPDSLSVPGRLICRHAPHRHPPKTPPDRSAMACSGGHLPALSRNETGLSPRHAAARGSHWRQAHPLPDLRRKRQGTRATDRIGCRPATHWHLTLRIAYARKVPRSATSLTGASASA
jgi:hypothetical protein